MSDIIVSVVNDDNTSAKVTTEESVKFVCDLCFEPKMVNPCEDANSTKDPSEGT